MSFPSTGLHGRRARQRDIAAIRHGQGARSETQRFEDDNVAFVKQPSPQQQQRSVRTLVQHIHIEFSVERQTDRGQSDADGLRTFKGAQL